MMLSSIGRAAIRRVSAGASHQSTNRVFQSILHLQRVARSSNVDSTFILRPSSLSLLRSYATASLKTKPKTKTSAAKAKPKTKTAAAKKPVKKPLKSKPKRKVAAKPKPKAKPKRKVLTDKQKEKAAKEKQTAALKALKATALSPPKGKPANTWAVLLAEFVTKGIAGGGHIGSLAKEASVKYKSLTTEEKEHYNHIANLNKAQNETAYKNWIDSHNPEEIRLANNARNQLSKVAAVKSSSKYSHLKDPRIPKRSRRAWVIFGQDRWSSGDLKGMSPQEATRLIIREWKELSPSQRKPYEDQEAADIARYTQEFKTVFGRDPSYVRVKQKAAA